MPARALIHPCFWVLLLFVTIVPAGAQVVVSDSVRAGEDTTALRKAEEFERINIPDSASLPDPRKSAFLSTILPGMGQVYNGALWKVPIVYAGGVVIITFVNFNQLRYSESLKNLRTKRYEPDTPGLTRTEDSYQREVDYYRRNRDFTIILGVAFYGLQIVEAYVDAHLQTFDLDEELSLRVRPALIPDPSGSMLAGIRITYTFP